MMIESTPTRGSSKLRHSFKWSNPSSSDVLYSRNNGVSGMEDPFYRVTFIKSAPTSGEKASGLQRGFGKILTQGYAPALLPMPRLITYSVKDFPDFLHMARAIYGVKHRPEITTILGSPNDVALELHDSGSPVLSRTRSFFDFETSRNSPSSLLTSYMVLDLDGTTSQPSYSFFRAALLEQTLTEEHIHLEARRCVSRLLAPADIDDLANYNERDYARYRGPMYVRLSSTFAATEAQTRLKAHIYVPLTDMIPIDQIMLYLYQHRSWLDSSMYRNPTQPVFTAEPIIDRSEYHIVDPLGPTHHDLPRQYYFDYLPDPDPDTYPALAQANPYKNDRFNSKGFPVESIKGYLGPSNSCIENISNDVRYRRSNKDRRHLTAINLSGKIGAFNRSTLLVAERSLESRLESMGYKKDTRFEGGEGASSRWISPESTSGSAGCVIYATGFVKDFHDNSPIQRMFKEAEIPSHALSPYHLYRLFALSKGEAYLRKFNAVVDRAYMQDALSQRAVYTGLAGYLSHLYEGMNRSEVDEVWQQILQDAFHQGIANYAKTRLYKDIVLNVKEKTQMRVTLEELKMYWSDLRRKLSSEMGDIVAANPETLNARLLMDESYLYKEPHFPYYLAESVGGGRLEMIRGSESMESRVTGLFLERSLDPDSWTYSKLKSNVGTVMKILNYEADHDPSYHYPKVAPSVYAFSPSKDEVNRIYDEFIPPKITAIDFITGKIIPIGIESFTMYTLPFTEADYRKAEKKSRNIDTDGFSTVEKYAPNWWAFMSSSFRNAPDRIETIRDVFTYCLGGSLSNQYLVALHGEPGSGKSTIKNLLVKLFGANHVLETDPARLGDDEFALAKLTHFTRLLVVNEFNTQMFHGHSSRRNRVVNFLKQLSGRDEVVVRQMRKDPQTIKSDALPLLISNTVPSINDSAFQSRLKSIHFDVGFDRSDGQQSNRFQKNLVKELPGIFYWAMTNPRKETIQKGGFQFLKTESLENDTKLSSIQANPLLVFLREYLEPTRHPEKGVARQELLYWLDLYLQKHLDMTLDEFLEVRRFRSDKAWVNRQAILQIFPASVTGRARLHRGEYLEIRDRCPNPSTGKRDWACGMAVDSKQTFYGSIKWRDIEAQSRELNDWHRPDFKVAGTNNAKKKVTK